MEFQIYDGRKIRPLLQKLAIKHNKSYADIKRLFIERVDKPAVKKLDEALNNLRYHTKRKMGDKMSVADDFSTYCRHNFCESYNVDGICEYHMVSFVNWIIKNKYKLTTENIEELWAKFENE